MVIGQIYSETDPNGATTYYKFDALGRLKAVASPGDSLGAPTQQAAYQDYAASPLRPFNLTLTQKDGPTVQKFYNGLGELIQTQTVGASLSDPNCSGTCDVIVDYKIEYQNNQGVSQQTAPYAVTQTNGYHTSTSLQEWTKTYTNSAGRKVQVVYPDGTWEVFSYAFTDVTVLSVSTRALEIMSTDPRSQITKTYLDAWGRTVKVIPPTGPGVEYGFDALDRLVKTKRGGVETILSYDLAGRKTSMTDPDMGSWSYGYDALGNLNSQVDAKACTTSLSYDPLNRLTGKSYTNSPTCGTSNGQVAYYYNNLLRWDDFNNNQMPSGWTKSATGVTFSSGQMHISRAWSLDRLRRPHGRGGGWDRRPIRLQDEQHQRRRHDLPGQRGVGVRLPPLGAGHQQWRHLPELLPGNDRLRYPPGSPGSQYLV